MGTAAENSVVTVRTSGGKKRLGLSVCPHSDHAHDAPAAPAAADLEQSRTDRLRAALGGLSGRTYWRSLDELAETPEFEQIVHREFPTAASEWTDAFSRRNFVKLMGASLALAGLAGCETQSDEKIRPYVKPPEGVVPGRPLYFATAMPLGGYARPVVAQSHEGRPTKLEGNDLHPASLGATDAVTQAAILNLYDPDRSQNITNMGNVTSWDRFIAGLSTLLADKAIGGPEKIRLRVLTETITSPTLADLLTNQLKQRFPQARWHAWEPLNHDNVIEGARLAFGRTVQPVYEFDKARVIVSLDSNFLIDEPGSVRYARDFVDGRRLRVKGEPVGDRRTIPGAPDGPFSPETTANRLYVIESSYTITGAKADHRLPIRASQVEAIARALEIAVRGGGGSNAVNLPDLAAATAWLGALVKDLAANRGASLVIAGPTQSPAVHALAHAINHGLGNVGKTVTYTRPLEAEIPGASGGPVTQLQSLRELLADIDAGTVDALVILGGNPVFSAPADLEFTKRIEKVKFRAHLGLYHDETAYHCHWHVPEAHFLEAWGDLLDHRGVPTLVQPLIAPLYNGKSCTDVLLAMFRLSTLGPPLSTNSSYEAVHNYWVAQLGSRDPAVVPENLWQAAVERGFVENVTAPALAVGAPAVPPAAAAPATQPSGGAEVEVVFRADPHVLDGRFANNGWLQELPKPLTRLVWDNAALISPATAARLNLATKDSYMAASEKLVELNVGGRKCQVPIWVQPGIPDDTITVFYGYGRTRAGRVGNKVGFDTYVLRTSGALNAAVATVTNTGKTYPLACTQNHQVMHGRQLVREDTFAHFTSAEHLASKQHHPHIPSMFPDYDYDAGHRWGMVVDQTACIGCNACVAACQAENNIPIVGKTEVRREREMHWLRIDTYYSTPEGGGDALANPNVAFQPVMCMHCEKAPCEIVCPVAATSHSSEGLNEMTYNRCVGTRYCSNNCPYKVRRFNFLTYTDRETPSLQLMYNPNVTVRARGVMEKCTYCVQRINATRTDLKRLRLDTKKAAEKAGERSQVERDAIVSGGNEQYRQMLERLQSACQQACPTEAIAFGDMNYTAGTLAKMKNAQPFARADYGMLHEELNTAPRTTYHVLLRNPNPEIKG